MKDEFTPTRADKFTFGLWTVGNRGRDPFGDFVRPPLKPTYVVQKLSDLGVYGVNLHDNDLVPIDATRRQRDKIVKEFLKALGDYDMCVPMLSTNLFFDPIFKDGAFTSNDPEVRAFAIQKVLRCLELGVELGAHIFIFWGGREGTEVDASKDPVEALKRYREALNFIAEYSLDKKYGFRFCLEPKPNEPRGDLFLPTTGSMLAFIETLDHPELFGVNPELAHEHMAGLNFAHVVAQALEAGKLWHVDLNAQKLTRFDQDLRFGSEDLKGAFFLVKVLEDNGYDGPRQFDAHAYRTEDEQGVWDFALGCMRTYKILKAKVKKFNQDPEIKEILGGFSATGGCASGAKIQVDDSTRRDSGLEKMTEKYSRKNVALLLAHKFDRQKIAARGFGYERLDQLTVEILMGVR